LKRPGSGQDLVNSVLAQSTQESDNPDIRDRAYVYWRLLSSNPEVAKAVVLAEKPPIDHDSATVSETLLDELIGHIGSLASVYHISPSLLGSSSKGYISQVDLKVDIVLQRTLKMKNLQRQRWQRSKWLNKVGSGIYSEISVEILYHHLWFQLLLRKNKELMIYLG
jgi:hypothetical protein